MSKVLNKKQLSEELADLKKRCCCKSFGTTEGEPTTPPVNGITVLFDTETGILYYWDGDSWESFSSGGGTFGVTELDPPVDAPVDDDPVVLINLTTGVIYYWNGAWLVANDGGTDTNFANTDLTLTGDRSHDGDGFNITLLDFLTILLKAISGGVETQVSFTPASDRLRLQTASGVDISLIDISGASGVTIDSTLGLYKFLTAPTTDAGESDAIFGRDSATGRVYLLPLPSATDTNVANTNLTLDGDRSHDLNGFSLVWNGLGVGAGYAFNADDNISSSVQLLLQPGNATMLSLSNGLVAAFYAFQGEVRLDSSNGVYKLLQTPPTDEALTAILAYDPVSDQIKLVTKPIDTNISTANLTFSANRTHDLVSRVLKFVGQIGASFDVEITGPSGIHKLHVDEDDVTMRAEMSATQYSYVDVNVLDTTIEARNNTLRHLIEVLPTYARLLSGAAGVDGAIATTVASLFLYNALGVYKFDKGDGTLGLPTSSDVTPNAGLALNTADGRVYRTTKPLISSDISNSKKDNIGLSLNGNGSVISTGYKERYIVPFDCTITGWTILETSETPIATSTTVDVLKGTYADYDTTPVFATIVGSEKPTLTTAVANNDLTLTSFTTALVAGDILEFRVDTNDLGKKILLVLHVTKTL